MTDEIFDTELQKIFGDSYQDDTKAGTVKRNPTPPPCTKASQKPQNDSMDDDVEWYPEMKSSFASSLTECVKSSVPFAGLNLLIFYWAQTGLMAESIAVPSMCVCAALFGVGIGKFVRRWK